RDEVRRLYAGATGGEQTPWYDDLNGWVSRQRLNNCGRRTASAPGASPYGDQRGRPGRIEAELGRCLRPCQRLNLLHQGHWGKAHGGGKRRGRPLIGGGCEIARLEHEVEEPS